MSIKAWMASRGVPFDAAGQVGNITAWPWKFRYPIGFVSLLAGLGASFWLYTSVDKQSHALAWLLLACTAMFFLTCAFELGCLGLVAAAIWGFVALVQAIVPDSWSAGPNNTVMAIVLALTVVYAAALGRRMERMEKERAAMYERITKLEHSRDARLLRDIKDTLDRY